MDPRSSAQDVHRCDLCEIATVHSYCDYCHVNLCKPCIGEHISDGYHKHTIVSFEERKSTLIYPKCETHPHKNCKFQCTDCENIFVCSSCVASEKHERHRFVEVSDVFQKKKGIIARDAEKLKNLISPKYEEISLRLENQLANLDEGYEKLLSEMSKQGEEWHREIDTIVNKMKTEISKIKMKHRDILQKHLDKSKQMESLILQTLLALKEIEKSTEVLPTIEYSSKIGEFNNFPPKLLVSLPTFIPKLIDRDKLYSNFGQITSFSTATEENFLPFNQPNTSVKELLDEPKLVATIQTRYTCLRSVSCLNEEQLWTSGLTYVIKCFDFKGSILQAIEPKSGEFPNAIAVDSDGDLLYCDGIGTVNKLKNGQPEVLIRLQEWKPVNLCFTSIADLLVIMHNTEETQSKVVRYSGSTEKQTIQFDDEGKPLFSGNDDKGYIAENKNFDVCVADCGACAVIVVNQDGKLKCRYTGQPSTTKKEPFEPQGITTDSQCHILIADYKNHCIHILDKNGQFLRYVEHCHLKNPSDVCVDSNDYLFVCDFGESNVKKIKYLK